MKVAQIIRREKTCDKSNDPALKSSRAAVRRDQAGHGPPLLSNEMIEQGGSGNEFDGLELQHQKSNQYHRSQADDRSGDLN